MSLETLNGIEYLGAHLKFKVPGYREKSDGHVYYRIVAQFTLVEPFKKVDFEYTYENCLTLFKTLSSQCPDLPQLPGIGLFGFKPNGFDTEKRRVDLEKWLGALVWRCDVLGSECFYNFCNLGQMLDKKWLKQPDCILKFNYGHSFPVQDFFYEPDTQVCFVLTTDDSIASKMQGLMGIFGKSIKPSFHSQLIGYRLDVDNNENPITQTLWTIQYQQRGTMIKWDEKLTILGIGFDDGHIICLRIATNKKYQEYSEFCYIHKHTQAVNGIEFNSLTGHCYSISKDKCLITTDLANPSSILKEKEFVNELTCLTTNQYRLFVGDNVGSIYIFSFENGPLHAVHQIKQDVAMQLTSIQYCPIKNYLICGSKEGYLSVFEIGKQGKEKSTNQITLLKTIPNKVVQFSISTKEIYVNYGSSVIILESTNMKYLYSLEAHNKDITKIQLFDSIGLLITSSKDNTVKFWQYKYFPHILLNNDILPLRKEPVAEHKVTIRQQGGEQFKQAVQLQQQQMKPELEDLDHWQ
ncbi:unnamed protein product (macronuclear) [Paramecium tetraurelia]|uniref:Uncharacterized protein n=1 Tax=Paramecium tetraurelia TaxID=5888 RepID=A0BCN6_PARTE|nr:uncharacterized protein GSPATT00004397001 [Paramecium tetraurelia]CAK56303.1 unnamed protein product [Paramecium tetraurelia]|eukprot:XP_001423701.1 hypothetical protein (macronuclear) [Paramecium tetraurelia strain d4-2]